MAPNADLEANAEKIADELVARGEIDPAERDEAAQAMIDASYASLTDPEASAALASCEAPGRQGFNLHDLIFPKAHAAVPVAIAVGAACGRYVMAQGARVLSWYYARQALDANVDDLIAGGGFTSNEEGDLVVTTPANPDEGLKLVTLPTPQDTRPLSTPIGNYTPRPLVTLQPDGQLPIVYDSSVFTPRRLQHASRHLIQSGILPSWNKATGEEFTRMGEQIIQAPNATFSASIRGGENVNGFVGQYKGSTIAVLVFSSGPYSGEVATAYVPTAGQLNLWGVKP
jgi:hypothetical protein